MPDESNPGPKRDKSRRHVPARPISGRLFYSGAAAVFLVLTLLGFQQYYRRRPYIHRPMTLMGTLVAMPAPISRIGPLNALYEGTVLQPIFGPFLWTLVIATFLLVVKWLISRKLDRWFAIGYSCLVASSLLIWQAGTTDAWDRFATLLL